MAFQRERSGVGVIGSERCTYHLLCARRLPPPAAAAQNGERCSQPACIQQHSDRLPLWAPRAAGRIPIHSHHLCETSPPPIFITSAVLSLVAAGPASLWYLVVSAQLSTVGHLCVHRQHATSLVWSRQLSESVNDTPIPTRELIFGCLYAVVLVTV